MTRGCRRTGLLRDRRGAAAIVVALAFILLMGVTALATDAGLLQWQRRRLQAAVDAAALSAARMPVDENRTSANVEALAQTILTQNGFPAARFTAPPRIGRYAGERADRIEELPGATPTAAPAVEIRAEADASIGLMRLFGGDANVRVAARAVAAQRPLAGFTVGSGLVSVDAANAEALNPLLGQLLGGTTLTLGAVDYNSLLGTNISLLPFFNTLASSIGVTLGDYDALLQAPMSVGALLGAAISALADTPDGSGSAASLALAKIAIGNTQTLRLGDLLSLGDALNPAGSRGDDASYATLGLNAYQLLYAAAAMGGRNQVVDLGSGLNVAGATVSANLTMIEPPVLALGPVGIQASTAQLRLALNIQLLNLDNLLGGLLGGTLRLLGARVEGGFFPITVDAAVATAELRDVRCVTSEPRTGTGMTIRVQPTAAAVNLGTAAAPATVARVALLGVPIATVTAALETQVGGGAAQDLVFTGADVLQGNPQSTSGGSQTLLGGLITNLQLRAEILPGQTNLITTLLNGVLDLLVSGLTPIVKGVLGLLDPLLVDLLDKLGIDIGYADVRPVSARCGVVALVR